VYLTNWGNTELFPKKCTYQRY